MADGAEAPPARRKRTLCEREEAEQGEKNAHTYKHGGRAAGTSRTQHVNMQSAWEEQRQRWRDSSCKRKRSATERAPRRPDVEPEELDGAMSVPLADVVDALLDKWSDDGIVPS